LLAAGLKALGRSGFSCPAVGRGVPGCCALPNGRSVAFCAPGTDRHQRNRG
jgi:hypothetical protein